MQPVKLYFTKPNGLFAFKHCVYLYVVKHLFKFI